MTPFERRKAIADYVLAHGEVRIETLTEEFGVSRMTIHRVIDELSRQGVIRKLHGSVSAQPSAVYEALFAFREAQGTEAKAALTRAALAHIEAGQSLMIDDSTTCQPLGAMLVERAPIHVVSNSLGLANTLAGVEGVSFLSTGGDYHPTYNAFIGHVCERALDALRVHSFVCSASAVQDGVALIHDAGLTRIKQAMFRAAEKRILLVHSDKFNKRALHAFAELSAFDHVITDDALDPATAEFLIASGVTLERVALT